MGQPEYDSDREEALEHLLLDRLKHPSPELRDAQGTISFDLGEQAWTIELRGGRFSLSWGMPESADSLVSTDEDTLKRILLNEISGVDAFLQGRLRVRRNLALSLRLNGAWIDRNRPLHFPVSRTVQAGSVKTFFLEGGQGPPLILLHGLGATNASFLTTFQEFARDHRVIAPDLPGFGESDKPIRPLHATFFSEWLRSFMDALDVDRASLIGNSMGGRVGIEMALSFPERVQKIVLVTPSAAFIKGRQLVQLVRVLRPELALIPSPVTHAFVVKSLKRMFSRPARLPDTWYEAAADEFLRVFRTARGRICFFSAARQIYLEEPYGGDGFWDRLPGVTTPTLFIWGEQDRLVPVAFEKHVTRALPNARSVVLPDCGHVPQFELPDQTHKLVRQWLESE